MNPRSRDATSTRSNFSSFPNLDLDRKIARLVKISKLLERQVFYLRSSKRRPQPNRELLRYVTRHQRIKALCATL
jgi:hypothetical protein